jgi:hypothetical protein
MRCVLRTVSDLAEMEMLWRACVPEETVFDLWEARATFHACYQRSLRCIEGYGDTGERIFLPLCWVDEISAWCFFPGETWSNKTWLEQNRLFLGGLTKERLVAELGGDFHLRYVIESPEAASGLKVDETGYLFHPPAHGYDIRQWWSCFTPRRRKKVLKELLAFHYQVDVRNTVEDGFDLLVDMNLGRFGSTSYFSDPRFRGGFSGMLTVLSEMGLLRVTTILIGNTPVAVDFGSVFRNRYTLLAGGVDARLPGVAKLINLRHLEWACEQQLDEVDFLCGDFSWKPLFHLTPRPLYLFTSRS